MTTVPILAYHSVADDPAPWIRPLSVAPQAFESHLEALAQEGATALTVTDFVRALAGDAALPRRPVVITFDDGFADFRDQALPALRKRGFSATLYVTTGFLDGGQGGSHFRPAGPWLDEGALVDLRDEGVEIGGHTHTHPHLDTLSPAAARREIASCKDVLERVLEQSVRSFAYPHGYLSASLRRIVRDCGYESACACKNALSSTDDDRFALARLVVRRDTPTASILTWFRGGGAPVAPLREPVRTRAWRSYRRGRAIVRRRAGYDWRQRRA